jgi:hypothetical protein
MVVSYSELPIVSRIYAISSLLILYFASFITILDSITIFAFVICLAAIVFHGDLSTVSELRKMSVSLGQNQVRQLIVIN